MRLYSAECTNIAQTIPSLACAPKVIKTVRQTTKFCRQWVPDRRAGNRESPTAECNPATWRWYSQL